MLKTLMKIVAAVMLVVCSAVGAEAAVTPQQYVSAVSFAGAGWVSATSIYSNNSGYASFNTTTQTLLGGKTFAFGSYIPAGSVINGMTVTIKGYNASGGANGQIRVGLSKNGTVLDGNWKTGVQLPTANNTVVVGGAADLWGTTWTADEVSAATFGVLVSDNDTVASPLYIDSISMVIDYTPPNIYGKITTNPTNYSGKSVRLVINGTDSGATTIDSTGSYYFPNGTVAGDAVMAYLDDDPTYKGAVVMVSNGSPLNMGDAPAVNTLTLSHSTAGPITTAHIAQALGAYTDTDLALTASGGNLSTTWGISVSSGDTFVPGGNVTAGNVTGAGTFRAGAGTHALGNIDIRIFYGDTSVIYSSGTAYVRSGYTFSASTNVVKIGGGGINFSGGTFTHNNGTIVLDGVSSSITGSATFYNLTKEAADLSALYLSSDITVNGKLTLKGGSANLLTIRSSVAGTIRNITLGSSASCDAEFIDTLDVGVSSTNAALIPVNPSNSINSGRSRGWFPGVYGSAPAGTTVRVVVKGVAVGSAVATGGQFFIDIPALLPGDYVIAYLEGGGVRAVTCATSNTGVVDASLGAGNANLRGASTALSAISNADISAAIGGYAHPDLPIQATGNDIIIGGGLNFSISLITYSPAGNITAGNFTNGGTFNGGTGTHTYTGNLMLTAGSYVASSGITNVGGRIETTTSGNFTHNNGIVVLTGGDQTIDINYSSISFYGLTKNTSVAATLTLTGSGGGIYLYGPVNLNGSPGQMLTISGPSVILSFKDTATKESLSYIAAGGTNVTSGAPAVSSSPAQLPINPTNSTASARGWFAQISGTAYSNKGTVNIGGAKKIRFLVDGVDAGFVTTTVSGSFNFTFNNILITNANQRIFAFVEGDVVNGGVVTVNPVGTTYAEVTGQHIWNNYLSIRTTPTATNADIIRAIGGYTSPDFSFSASGSDIVTNMGLVSASNYTPGGNIEASALDIMVSTAFTLGGSNLVVSGDVINSGTFYPNSGNVTVSGVFTNNNVFSAGTGTHRFGSFYRGGNTYSASSGTTYISGDILGTNAFTHNNGTVVLNGNNQIVEGATTFYNLTKEVSAAASLTFGGTIAIANKAILKGAPGQLLAIRSSVPGTKRSFRLTSTNVANKDLAYLYVIDSDASLSAAQMKPLYPDFSVNAGNNVSWFGALIDAAIKKAASGDFVASGIAEASVTTQYVEDRVLNLTTAEFNISITNAGESTDTTKITGPASTANFTIQYLDELGVDRTAEVVAAGYTTSVMASGETRVWTVKITPAATTAGGTAINVDTAATSIASGGTKVDVVRATVTSNSARITSSMTTSKLNPGAGEDVTLTVTGSSVANLTDAKDAYMVAPVPANTAYKIGSELFIPNTSTLTLGGIVFSNDGQGSWTYTPVSGGCGAPAGYDACVSDIKWTTVGVMPPGTSLQAKFGVQVK